MGVGPTAQRGLVSRDHACALNRGGFVRLVPLLQVELAPRTRHCKLEQLREEVDAILIKVIPANLRRPAAAGERADLQAHVSERICTPVVGAVRSAAPHPGQGSSTGLRVRDVRARDRQDRHLWS